MKRGLLIGLLLAFLTLPAQAAERIGVFFGTLTGGNQYVSYLEQFYGARSDTPVEVWEFSRSGDTTETLLPRIGREVDYCEGMSRALVMVGNEEPLEGYQARLSSVVDAFSSRGVEVVLFSPVSIHDPKHDGDRALDQKRDIVRMVAEEKGCKFGDTYGAVVTVNGQLKEESVRGGLYPDGLSMSSTGQLLLAQVILDACGDLPAEKCLPIVTFDARSNSFFQLKNATAVEASAGSFTYKAERLPLPLTDSYRQLGERYPIENRDFVRIIGLEAGTYRLFVNGREAGLYSDGALSGGISLSECDAVQDAVTPIRHKAGELARANRAAIANVHLREFAELGIVENGASYEAVKKLADQALKEGRTDQAHHDSLLDSKGREEIFLREAGSAREAFRSTVENRQWTVTFEQVSEGKPSAFFSDTDTHWGRTYIEALYRQGLIRGKTQSVFDPDGGLTRAELLTLAIQLTREPITAGESYKDVRADAWFSSVVATAKGLGLIPKPMVEDGNFCPDAPITREELASVLVALYEKTNRVAPASDLDGFSDRDALSKTYEEAVSRAVGLGLMSGNADGSLNPQGGLTRAEAATVLFRLQAIL